MLHPADLYLWDFWFAPRKMGEPYHLFYLHAPRSLPDPDLRHAVATIGHAVSDDLHQWQQLPTAFNQGAPGSWDDRAIWTGSIIERAGTYYFFYTGTQLAEDGLVQRIGLATSSDLQHWQRHAANPLLEADPRWYEKLGGSSWWEEAWRDPCVVWSPADGCYLMFITARVNYGPADGRGVIGCARSSDLLHWEALPPVSEPGEFAHLEVPQVLALDGRYYLLFCTASDTHSAARRTRAGDSAAWFGTHYLVSERLAGPYALSTDVGLAVGAGDYAGKIIEGPDGSLCFLAWQMHGPDGAFAGALSDPLPLLLLPDGKLAVRYPAANP